MNMNHLRQNNRKTLPKVYYFSEIILTTSLLFVILLAYLSANNYKINLDFKPYNGAFQTFNPLRRIYEGEIPGRDFNPYLGLGTTYVNAFITYIFGGDFAASQFSTHFISLILHLITLVTLFFLSGVTIKKSIVASSFIILAISFDLKRLAPFWELAGPGNSNLSIRSALPFLTSLAIFLVFRFCRRNPKLFYSIVGCIIGIQPLWSNDYGLPSCLTLTVIIIIDFVKKERAKKLFKATLLFVSAFIAFFLAASILTVGHPLDWVRDNFSGVAADQFWYYVWYNGKNKIFSLTDIFSHPFLYIYSGLIILLTMYTLFKSYTIKLLLLLYVSITVFGAGILSSVGGAISVHYYLASILVSFFIFSLLIYLFISNFISGEKKLRLKKILENKINKYYTKQIKHCLLIILIIFYTTSLVTNSSTYQLFSLNSKNNLFFIKELGGWLPNRWNHAIEIAKDINGELKNELPTQRVLSTYSSAMDVVAGAFNPTGIDYLIHALGDHTRTHYLEQFKNSKPKYITTLREDFTKWETWLRRTNWWFYREFVYNYQPVEATFYNIVWKRLEQPKSTNHSQAICRVIQESDNKVKINITTENKDDDKVYYIDIALKYHLKVEHSGIPIIGGRGLVNATEQETALTRSIAKDSNRSYGMPPSHKNWHIPIEHRLGTVSVLEITGYPKERSKLIVEACQARLFAPVDSFAVTRSLTPASGSNADWKNGISIISEENPNFSHTGFIISDQEALPEIYPGMDVEFSKSGRRQIIEIKDNRIWVTGPSLDPLDDGYPNPIIVTLR